MTWVKVCGLRTQEDVRVSIEAGADAIGLVVAPSPRWVNAKEAAELVHCSESEVITVLVTLDTEPDEIFRLLDATGAVGVQPHGVHSEAASTAARSAGFFTLRPVMADEKLSLENVPPDQIPLIDAPTGDGAGGSGRTFDWSLTQDLHRRFVLAGGLGPDNVADAIHQARPWGVDASSGLESSPGVKDHRAIRSFLAEARRS